MLVNASTRPNSGPGADSGASASAAAGFLPSGAADAVPVGEIGGGMDGHGWRINEQSGGQGVSSKR